MISETRLPLQTGATMLRRLLVTAAAVDGACLFVAASDAARGQHGVFAGIAAVEWPLFFAPIAAVVLMAVVGSARASDCVLEPDELRIEGGKYDGFRMAWSQIERALMKDGVLHLELGSGVSVPIAVASDRDEIRSIEALQRSIEERAKKRADAPPPPVARHATSVLACSVCGAPVAPDDRDDVACHFCGVRVAVPDDLRARIRAARSLRKERASLDAVVARLLNQPSAQRVNRWLAAMAAITIVWLPMPLFVGSTTVAPLSVVAALLVALVAYAVIADRRAIRVLTLDFAARGAERAGDPDRCRRCDAPLPPSDDDAILVTCAYCEADNVLGLDARAADGAARTGETTYAATLHERERARRTARLVALAGSAILIAATVLLHVARR